MHLVWAEERHSQMDHLHASKLIVFQLPTVAGEGVMRASTSSGPQAIQWKDELTRTQLPLAAAPRRFSLPAAASSALRSIALLHSSDSGTSARPLYSRSIRLTLVATGLEIG